MVTADSMYSDPAENLHSFFSKVAFRVGYLKSGYVNFGCIINVAISLISQSTFIFAAWSTIKYV